MNFKDVNHWLLLISIVLCVYFLVRAWHIKYAIVKQDECNLCSSKKFYRIKRDTIYKVFPFNSKKYHCKDCKKEYLVIRFFRRKLTISHNL